jgi:hypothetical protein
MTRYNTEKRSPSSAFDPIVDHETLRDTDDIPFHEQTDVVDEDVVEQVASLDDLAGAGITNENGELLFRRLTDTCSWKIPVQSVDPEEDFAQAITDHIQETIGFTVALVAVDGVWDIRVETEDGEKSASRAFVIFSASPVSGNYDLAAVTPEDDPVEEAGWFGEIPPETDRVPGTDLFLE